MNKTLQEKVKQDLEKSGILAKIRNLFKEKIYESIKAQQQNIQLKGDERKNKVLETKSGQICLTLIQDFLDSFGLGLTLSVFLPEVHQESSKENIQILENALGAKSTPRNPLLFEVIERAFNDNEEGSGDIEFEDDGIDEEIDAGSSQRSVDDHLGESGYDQSTNSLAMNEFDYIENVRRVKL